MRSRRVLTPLLAAVTLLLGTGTLCTAAAAQGLEDDGGASWRLEQPEPPKPPPGVPEAPAPIGLGKVGDIEFWAANRGALITAGNPPTIAAGLWEYNGLAWHELSTVCGATDGRIAWAGPEEFWTISDGRSGQAIVENKTPPLADDTLCRFSNPKHEGEPLRVMESFAFPAFQVDSYQAMHAAACLSATDCWFAGDSLPRESLEAGSFHLHWNGHSLSEEPYPGEGHAVEEVRAFEGHLYESVRLRAEDKVENPKREPPVLHVINPEGGVPVFEALTELPLYESEEFPTALDFLHLSAGEEILWAAAGPQSTPEGSKPGQVTILRDSGGAWTQVLGPETSKSPGEELFPGETVNAIAAEPETNSAWIALDTLQDAKKPSATAAAQVARVSPDGTVSPEDEQALPTSAEPGVGPKGAAYKLTCPAVHDCWLATTQGWLFHLASEGEQTLPEDADPAFETLITERPPDQGLPQNPPDTLPEDDSGLLGELNKPPASSFVESSKPPEYRVTLPLLSNVHSRLVHGSTLELRFHLAARARIRMLAKRGKQVVAATAMRTFSAGNRSLQLRLNRKRWPTKISLQTQALAALPTASTKGVGIDTVSTSLVFPKAIANADSGLLP